MTQAGKQRYRCHNTACSYDSFVLNPAYQGRVPEIKAQVLEMARHGSGIRDTVRVLNANPSEVCR